MKKYLILLFSVFTLNMFSQNNSENLVFVFDKMSDFTDNFSNRENPKEYSFIIKNLPSENVQTLINNIINYRGVTNFTISGANENGERTANITLYKYADHWKYYEFLFSKNRIYKIIIENIEYNPAGIGNQ